MSRQESQLGGLWSSKKEWKMKKLLILSVLALTSADLSAREPLLVPSSGQLAMAPEPTLIDAVPVEQGTPVPYSQYIVQQPVQVIQLYQNVRVRDLQNVHPNAVRKIISIPNPRDKCSRVNIEISFAVPLERWRETRLACTVTLCAIATNSNYPFTRLLRLFWPSS